MLFLMPRDISEAPLVSRLGIFLCGSDPLKKRCIRMPNRMLMVMDPMVLAKPMLSPRTLAVNIMAKILIAGPE